MENKVIGFNFKSEKHKRAASELIDITYDDMEKADENIDFETNSLIEKRLIELGVLDVFAKPFCVEVPTFESELRTLINKYSKESASNTPDYILSAFLAGCLKSWELTTNERDKHYGANFDPENQNTITIIDE